MSTFRPNVKTVKAAARDHPKPQRFDFTYLFLADAQRILERQEGFRPEPYEDPRGYPTVGYGCRLPLSGLEVSTIRAYRLYVAGPHETVDLSYEALFPLSETEARDFLLRPRLDLLFSLLAERARVRFGIVLSNLPVNVNIGLALMVYQLGVDGTLGFRKMFGALGERNWDNAAMECLKSRWYAQTPSRVDEVRKLFRTV